MKNIEKHNKNQAFLKRIQLQAAQADNPLFFIIAHLSQWLMSLTRKQRRLLNALFTLYKKTGHLYVAQETLAQWCKMRRETVNIQIKEFHRLGVIRKIRRGKKTQKWRKHIDQTCLYVIPDIFKESALVATLSVMLGVPPTTWNDGKLPPNLLTPKARSISTSSCNLTQHNFSYLTYRTDTVNVNNKDIHYRSETVRDVTKRKGIVMSTNQITGRPEIDTIQELFPISNTGMIRLAAFDSVTVKLAISALKSKTETVNNPYGFVWKTCHNIYKREHKTPQWQSYSNLLDKYGLSGAESPVTQEKAYVPTKDTQTPKTGRYEPNLKAYTQKPSYVHLEDNLYEDIATGIRRRFTTQEAEHVNLVDGPLPPRRKPAALPQESYDKTKKETGVDLQALRTASFEDKVKGSVAVLMARGPHHPFWPPETFYEFSPQRVRDVLDSIDFLNMKRPAMDVPLKTTKDLSVLEQQAREGLVRQAARAQQEIGGDDMYPDCEEILD